MTWQSVCVHQKECSGKIVEQLVGTSSVIEGERNECQFIPFVRIGWFLRRTKSEDAYYAEMTKDEVCDSVSRLDPSQRGKLLSRTAGNGFCDNEYNRRVEHTSQAGAKSADYLSDRGSVTVKGSHYPYCRGRRVPLGPDQTEICEKLALNRGETGQRMKNRKLKLSFFQDLAVQHLFWAESIYYRLDAERALLLVFRHLNRSPSEACCKGRANLRVQQGDGGRHALA